MKKYLAFVVIVFAVIFFPVLSVFASWPERPIRLIVPLPAGGGTDIFIRSIAPFFEKELGQKIIISNMPGANGGIGSLYVWNASHDGYTWVALSGNSALSPLLTGNKITTKDWFMALAAEGRQVLAVNASAKITTMNNFLAAARSGQELRIAGDMLSVLQIERLNRVAGLKLKPIIYTGGGPAKLACASQETHGILLPVGEYSDYIQSGQFIPLFVLTQEEEIKMEDWTIPTLSSVVPEWRSIDISPYFAIAVPEDTPDPVKNRFAEAFDKVMQRPEMINFITHNSLEILNRIGQEAAALAVRHEAIAAYLMQELGLAKYSPQSLGIETPK